MFGTRARACELDLLGVGLKLRRVNLLERSGEGGDGVVVGAALERREDSHVDGLLVVVGLSCAQSRWVWGTRGGSEAGRERQGG